MTTPRPTSAFKLEFHVDGTTSDVVRVRALIQALEATVRRHGLKASTRIVPRFDPPGLRGLHLGNSSQATLRRSALGAMGIFTIEQLCELTAHAIENALSDGTLLAIRRGLYYHEPRLTLKGDDPARFPLLIDSLRLSGQQYARLRDRGITLISQLTQDMIEAMELRYPLTRHAKDFPDHQPAGA